MVMGIGSATRHNPAMGFSIAPLAKYLHLARAAGVRQRPLVRDRLMLLAAVQAQLFELPSVAAYCRRQILERNPRHMIRRWSSMAEALEAADFQTFFLRQHRHYPLEKVERMLERLGIDLAREESTYASPLEYAAALLGTTVKVLERE